MKLPYLNETNPQREFIDVFRGYNHNLRIGDGEFYDMKNLSTDNYPVLSTRQKRGVYYAPQYQTQTLNGIIAKDELCRVVGRFLYVGEELAAVLVDDSPKTLVSMGSYVIVLPDKKYVNTVPNASGGYDDDDDIISTQVYSAKVMPSSLTGILEYKTIYKGRTAPTLSFIGLSLYDCWIDTSVTPNVWKTYNRTTESWDVMDTPTYIKISAEGIGSIAGKGDVVKISSSVSAIKGEHEVVYKDDDYIVIEGSLDTVHTKNAISFEFDMPEMDFVVSAGNRLWGCRYGENAKGEMVNEIYASKLGDFREWICFEGISTDSWTASVGSDGPFTGATTYLGYPIFFKENCMHRVFGDYPANFRIETTECRGVQPGSERSLVTVNEVLYYKTRSGVCAYDGSLPVEISSALGDERYSNAVAGALGNKYYISMQDASGKYHLFVYDTAKGMWHREDDTQATAFAEWEGDLYYIDYADNQIKSVRGSGVLDETPIEWMAETGLIGMDSPDKKYVSRIDVRIQLNADSVARVWAQYDSGGDWELLATLKSTTLRTFAAPIRPKRCDHMRLRFEGSGAVKIFSICKTIEEGSDV